MVTKRRSNEDATSFARAPPRPTVSSQKTLIVAEPTDRGMGLWPALAPMNCNDCRGASAYAPAMRGIDANELIRVAGDRCASAGKELPCNDV